MIGRNPFATLGAMALAILAGAGPAQADDPPAGIVAWWRAEGNSQDSSGSNHGTMIGGAAFSNGVAGQCFMFDGVSGYVDVTNSGALDFGTNDFTLCAWTFFSSAGGGLGTDQDIFQKSLGTYPNDRGYLLEYVTGETHPVLRFRVSGTSANLNDLMLSAPLVVDHWFHVAAVRSGNTSRIYLDGSSLGGKTAGSNIDVGTGGEARIGAKVHMGAGRYFRGAIDELSLYGRVLTDAEIHRLATLPPRLSLSASPGRIDLSWTSQSNRAYQVWFSPDLTANSWTSLGAAVVSTGHVTSTNDAAVESAGPRFYRVSTPVP